MAPTGASANGDRHKPQCETPATSTLTFLFADIEGSTEKLTRLGDAYASILRDHHRIIRAPSTLRFKDAQQSRGHTSQTKRRLRGATISLEADHALLLNASGVDDSSRISRDNTGFARSEGIEPPNLLIRGAIPSVCSMPGNLPPYSGRVPRLVRTPLRSMVHPVQ
jgi:hypothetical protein